MLYTLSCSPDTTQQPSLSPSLCFLHICTSVAQLLFEGRRILNTNWYHFEVMTTDLLLELTSIQHFCKIVLANLFFSVSEICSSVLLSNLHSLSPLLPPYSDDNPILSSGEKQTLLYGSAHTSPTTTPTNLAEGLGLHPQSLGADV